jgi:hypothetical protein
MVNSFNSDGLPITELELIGARGEVHLAGLQARLQFANAEAKYELTYR